MLNGILIRRTIGIDFELNLCQMVKCTKRVRKVVHYKDTVICTFTLNVDLKTLPEMKVKTNR